MTAHLLKIHNLVFILLKQKGMTCCALQGFTELRMGFVKYNEWFIAFFKGKKAIRL